MHRVLSNPAAPRGTPVAHKGTTAALMRTPAVTRNIPVIARDIPANEKRYLSDNGHFQTLDDLLRFILVCIMLGVKFPHWEEFMKSYMKSPKKLLDAHMKKSSNSGVLSIQIFFMFGPVSSATIIDLFKTNVKELFEAEPSIEEFFDFNHIDLWFKLKPKFYSLFEEIAGKMLNPESGQILKSDQMMKKITKDQEPSIKALPGIREETFDEIQSHNLSTAMILEAQVNDHRGNLTELFGLLPHLRSPESIRVQNAVIFCEPSVPAPLQVSQHVTPNLVDHPVEIVRVLADPPHRNHVTDLIFAGVKSVLKTCVDDAVALAANSFAVGNRSTVMAITGAPLDAQVLATQITHGANQAANEANSTAFAASEVKEAVTAAADAGDSVQFEPEFEPGDAEAADLFLEIAGNSPLQPDANGCSGTSSNDSSGVQSLVRSNFILTNIYDITSRMLGNDNIDLPATLNQNVENVSSNLRILFEMIDNYRSNTTSPLLPNGEGQAQSPPQGVEDGAPGDHPPFSAADLNGSAAVPKSPLSNLVRNPSSGQNGTPPTHEPLSMLLAASMPSSPQSAFTPAAVTSADGSPLAQSSSKPLEPAPLPPPKTRSVITKMNGGSAQSSGNPIGNPPGIVQSNVGVGRNLPANLTSLSSQGDGGGPPVQVLARSVDPPGNSGGADHLETPSSSKFWSSCIPSGKNRFASRRQQAPQSRRGWCNFFQSGKNRVNPSQGETGGTRPPVAHSSDNPSECAATTPPLSQTVVLPAGRTGIGGSPSVAHLSGNQSRLAASTPPLPSSSSPLGGKIGGITPAHSLGDPPGFVPSPAPSSSSALGSAANSAADPHNETPPTSWGVEIFGIERDVVRSPFDDIATVLLNMKKTKAPQLHYAPWYHPQVHSVPNFLVRQASVA